MSGENISHTAEVRASAGEQVRPWDLLNPNKERSSEELAAYRLSICEQCPALRPLTKTCRKCGCFMSLKTTLAGAYCPIGKW